MIITAHGIALLAAVLAALGILQCLAGWFATFRFAALPTLEPVRLPPVTLLKPLCGNEPLLEESLASCCAQTYPTCQIVFGVQDPDDAALLVVERLRAKFPDLEKAIIVDPKIHGPNLKIANLINMLPAARHNILVFSDSDLHVAPDYLEHLVAALEQPGVGLISTLYLGRPAGTGFWQSLGATQISHVFLPGTLLARALGRQDCLGNTMVLHRETLERAGGLHGLVGELADDNLLGQRVRALGLKVGLADIVTAATVPESSLAAMWQHELRWARTIRALAPAAFAASALQYPIFWAFIALLLSHAAPWAVALAALSWLVRAGAAYGIEHALRSRLSRPATPTPSWLLPLRDFLSIAIIVASFAGSRVVWRGHILNAGFRMAPRPGE